MFSSKYNKKSKKPGAYGIRTERHKLATAKRNITPRDQAVELC